MTGVAAVLALSGALWAGPVGARDPHAAPPTGFPGAFVATVAVSRKADKDYGDHLLDGLLANMRAVTSMTSPEELSDYLDETISRGQGLDHVRQVLGREPMDASRTSALLLAEALTRPAQFREVLMRLETLQSGLEFYAARILRHAGGAGDKRLIAAVRDAGEDDPNPEIAVYPLDKRFARFFDSYDQLPSVPSVPAARGLDLTGPR